MAALGVNGASVSNSSRRLGRGNSNRSSSGGRDEEEREGEATAVVGECFYKSSSSTCGSNSSFFNDHTTLQVSAEGPTRRQLLLHQQQHQQQQERQQHLSFSRWGHHMLQLGRRWRRRLSVGYYRHQKSLLLLANSLLFIISATANPVALKNMIDKFPNYSCFISQATTLVSTFIFLLAAAGSYYCGHISTEMRRYPKRNFAIMGFFDSLSGILIVVGGVYTSGVLQVVLGQLCIVVSMAASVVILRKRYHLIHYLGITILILGVVIVQWPSTGESSSTETHRVNRLGYNILFSLSTIPLGLSGVYREVALRGVEMNINYLQAWTGVYQFFWNFLLLPVQSLPALGPEAVPLQKLLSTFWTGFWCLFGYDTIVSDCDGADEPPCDSCNGAWVAVPTYLAVNVLFNVFCTIVLKLGGAALLFVVMALRVPLSALAFSSRFIMGDRAVPVKATDVCGLVVLLVGLGIYRLGSIRRKRSQRRRLAAAAAAAAVDEGAEGGRRPATEAAVAGCSGSLLLFGTGKISDTCRDKARPLSTAATTGAAAEDQAEDLGASLRYRILRESSGEDDAKITFTEDEEEEDDDLLTETQVLPSLPLAPEPTQVHLRRPRRNSREVLEAGGYSQLPCEAGLSRFSVTVTSPSGHRHLRLLRQPYRDTSLPHQQ